MKHPIDYIRTRDIDWFFTFEKAAFHVASARGDLPEEINDIQNLRLLQYCIANLPDINKEDEVIINEQIIEIKFNNTPKFENRENNNQSFESFKKNYIQSFMSFAKKGLISIDRTDFYNPEDSNYHIVCFPKNILYSIPDIPDIPKIPEIPNLSESDFEIEFKNELKNELKEIFIYYIKKDTQIRDSIWSMYTNNNKLQEITDYCNLNLNVHQK